MSSLLPELRPDGRRAEQMRSVTIVPDFISQAEGSVLVSMGETRVICTASLEERVPAWMRGRPGGWLTASYAMIPRATRERTARESQQGKVGGRTHEIQRLIGRSMRAVVDLQQLSGRTLHVDCDVIGADGGTRTASITGAWVAAAMALGRLTGPGPVAWRNVVKEPLAAISVGLVGGRPCLDLNYDEDSSADVDMNVVMTGDGRFVEVQGTAEGAPFDRATHDAMLDLASAGIQELIRRQLAAIEG